MANLASDSAETRAVPPSGVDRSCSGSTVRCGVHGCREVATITFHTLVQSHVCDSHAAATLTVFGGDDFVVTPCVAGQ